MTRSSEPLRARLMPALATPLKRRVVFVVLVILTLWPLAHHALVAKYDINPWLFFGLSMYTSPRPYTEIVSIEIAYPGLTFRALSPQAAYASLPLRSSLRKLADGRTWYGTLYDPAPAAAEMFAALPGEIDRLAFTTRRLLLDKNGMLVARDTHIECHKARPPNPVTCTRT